MALYKVGIIGCGGRGKAHARGFQASPEVEIVACADPVEEPRAAFAKDFDVPQTYEDYREMLELEGLDIVSVCTWTGLHTEQIIAAANNGVKAIHAEKPMAPTWGESLRLYQACVDNNVIITFCHQRRFGAVFRKAKELAHDGTIGTLYRVEGACHNLFDWGTHWFDMFFFYNNDEPAEWVIGQIDVNADRKVFAVPVETSGVSWIRYQNGLEGLLTTGETEMQGAVNRLVGSRGVIEVRWGEEPLRVLRQGGFGWQSVDLAGEVMERNDTTLATLDLIDALKTGREPELSGRKALQATELIFATYESSRRRAKITLPLDDIEDSPLITMLEKGIIGSQR